MDSDVSDGLAAFFNEIEPLGYAYAAGTFSFFGIRHAGGINILKAVVRLDPLHQFQSRPIIEVGHYVAGTIRIDDSFKFLPSLLGMGDLPSGVDSDAGRLTFYAMDGYSARMKAFDERGLASYSRFTTLRVDGTIIVPALQPKLDWQLRANETPYSDIADLGAEYGFGALPAEGSSALLEVEAHNVAAISGASTIEGRVAKLEVRLAQPLLPDKLSVGVKVIVEREAYARLRVAGAEMRFEPDEKLPKILVGRTELDVPENALLHCYVSYDGSPLHAYFVHEPHTAANPLRTALETFDPDLKNTKLGLGERQSTKRDTNQASALEHATGALLFMLGFAVFRIESPKLNDAPDLIAHSPSGHFLVVECTTGTFPGEKRSKLLKRAAEVRARLRSSWGSSRVLPVIVTSEPASVAQPSIPDAHKEGIAVITGDDLEDILANRTLLPQDAGALFEELESSIQNS